MITRATPAPFAQRLDHYRRRVDQKLADEGGQELADTFNAVTELLTEDAIITMNAAVALNQCRRSTGPLSRRPAPTPIARRGALHAADATTSATGRAVYPLRVGTSP